MTVPAYAGLPGLYRCHPVELASQLFGMLFGGGSLVAPERPLHQVDQCVARLAGLDLNTGLLGTVERSLWTQLQPYVLDTVAIWQSARVAAVRIVGSDHTGSFIYLLRRGERLLRSADPVTTLHGWLPADPELR